MHCVALEANVLALTQRVNEASFLRNSDKPNDAALGHPDERGRLVKI